MMNTLKITIRNLVKNKTINGINIIGLSVSMAIAMLILLWVQNEFSFDSYHKGSSRIYLVTNFFGNSKESSNRWDGSPYALGKLVEKDVPGIAALTSFYKMYQPVFNVNGQLFNEENAVYVEQGWFSMFSYDFISGNPQAFYNSPYSIILTESKAKKYFGNSDPIGRIVRKDTIDYTVQGIVKDNPANSSFQFDIFIPNDAFLANPKQRAHENLWENFNYPLFVKIAEGANPGIIASRVQKIIRTNKGDSGISASLVPLADLHFDTGFSYSRFLHANKKTVYIFEVLAFLILIIACINYVNLTTAKAGTRVKEVSIKKIVGAGKRQLFFQFIFETLVVCFLALFITLVLVYSFLPFFDRLTEKHFILSPNSWILWKVLGGTLLISVLLNGIYPAILLSSFKPLNIFKGLNMLKLKDHSLRKALVVTQFVISVTLIIGTIVIYDQLLYIKNQNKGYDRSQIFEIKLPSSFFRNNKDFDAQESAIKQELLAQTSIIGVTNLNSSLIDFENGHSGSLDWDGRDKIFNPTVAPLSADEDLQKLLNLQLAEGRWFQNGFNDRKNVILNETAIREFGIHQPYLGQRFAIHGDTGQIIGIVKDFYFRSLHDKIGPIVISNDPEWRSSFYIKTKSNEIPAALAATKKVWSQFINNKPFEYSFLDEQFNTLYKDDQKTSMLIGIFASIAIIISCLGLFGLAVFTAERRVKEIGIRKVLGASLKDIATLLSKDFILLVIIGVIIASPIAWWAVNKWLEDFAYHIAVSWWFFAVAAFLVLFIAICTISVQAVRAGMANPVKSLRTE